MPYFRREKCPDVQHIYRWLLKMYIYLLYAIFADKKQLYYKEVLKYAAIPSFKKSQLLTKMGNSKKA